MLGVDVTTIDGDFFALGGHSLLLVRLAAAIRRDFDVDVPVAELMVAPTVADVANLPGVRGRRPRGSESGSGAAPARVR